MSTRPYTEPADDPTARGHATVRVAVAGDIGYLGGRVNPTALTIAEIAARRPFDVLLLLGDNVYPSGNPAHLDETVFQPFAPVIDAGATLLAILGNHDVRRGHGDAQLEALGMAGRWWSHEIGDTLIVGLDSNRHRDPTQTAWLERTLGDTDARWRIAAIHAPPYSCGYQGSNHHVRETFVPFFERYGVQLVLSGHDHDYQRSHPINGVTYVVAGAAARARRTGDAGFTAVSFATRSFVELTISSDRLVGRAVTAATRIADEWVLERWRPSRQ